MKRIIVLVIILCGAMVRPETELSDIEKLNILLFTADDLDRNSLGCYGSVVPDISPNIDRFAAEGILFKNAYINYSICAPSRGILATGLYGHNSGVMGFMKMKEGSSIPLIMEIFREHDYRVGILGKVSHSTPKNDFTWDYVFDQMELGRGRSPSLYYERAKRFFESCRKAGEPFYFMVNSHDPHRPFFNPEEPLEGGMEAPSHIYSENEISVPGFLPDLPEVRKEVCHYYNSVKRLDDTFGKVMQALDESGYKENTLVVFISDNGIALPFAKCDNYYASSRTPWLVRWPEVIKSGTVDDENFISEVDFMPTILDAAGIVPPKKLDGLSHLLLYKGFKQDNSGMVFTQIDSKARGKSMHMRGASVPMRGVQTSDYLYIFNAWVNGKRIYANNNEGKTMKAMEEVAKTDPEMAERVQFFRYRVPEEFYNLRKDPDCLRNLMDDPAYDIEINKMRISLKKWMKKTDDPLLYIFRNRENPEKVKPKLYEIYPEIKRIDESEITIGS